MAHMSEARRSVQCRKEAFLRGCKSSHGNLEHREYQPCSISPYRVYIYVLCVFCPLVLWPQAPGLIRLSSPFLGWVPERSLTRSQTQPQVRDHQADLCSVKSYNDMNYHILICVKQENKIQIILRQLLPLFPATKYVIN